jgi:large subunit ribosomal protein L1
VEFKVDKKGNLHIPVGKASFTTDKLSDNIKTFVNTVVRLKPSTSKGIYLKNISISSTMGPGLKVSVNQ